jgi:glyoxylase-like metal-dependent hydrolase (beta-lactamase superfamily II)
MSTITARLIVGTFFAAAATGTTLAQGQAPAPQPITIQQIAPNVWVGVGGGGNSTVIAGRTSVIVVDAKTTEAAGKELLSRIAETTQKPVRTVIFTHSDGDHVNGIAAFPAGVTIIAHENNRKELDAALTAGGRGAPPADRLPTRLVTANREPVTIDDIKLELYHWAPAHTSGDLVVFLPDQKIAATGDLVVTNRADDNPNIHAEKNGSTAGWLESVRGLIGLNADTYVTGHGELLKKADLERKLTATTERRNKIADMIKQGKTLDEIKAALPDAAAPGAAAAGAGGRQAGPGAPAPGRGGPPPATFVDIAYRELGGK